MCISGRCPKPPHPPIDASCRHPFWTCRALIGPHWCCWAVHNCISRICTQTLQKRQTATDVSDSTFDCIDDTVAIFYQLFEEFTRPLQLYFIWFESLSEVWTVQIAIAELQGRMSHLLTTFWGVFHSRNSVSWVSHAAETQLPHNIHLCSFLEVHCAHLPATIRNYAALHRKTPQPAFLKLFWPKMKAEFKRILQFSRLYPCWS